MNDESGDSTWKREQWRTRIHGWKESGLSMRAYCRREGIGINGLRYWKARLPEPHEKRKAVKVSVRPLISASVVELVVAERFTVRVPDSFSSEHLERLVKTLEEMR